MIPKARYSVMYAGLVSAAGTSPTRTSDVAESLPQEVPRGARLQPIRIREGGRIPAPCANTTASPGISGHAVLAAVYPRSRRLHERVR
jgi:hypothetical protein